MSEKENRPWESDVHFRVLLFLRLVIHSTFELFIFNFLSRASSLALTHLLFIKLEICFLYVHVCLKAVSPIDQADGVKPQESPTTQAHVTEIPPTSTPPPPPPPPSASPLHPALDNSLSEVDRAAVYRVPEVGQGLS